MNLTEEQIEFLNKVCGGREYWTLNSNGEVDVIHSGLGISPNMSNVIMCNMNLTEIPIKFGRVDGYFDCSNNNLTTLKNCPNHLRLDFYCVYNPLYDYFKSVKEEDFELWGNLQWHQILEEYPFMINIMIKNRKKYFTKFNIEGFINRFPLTKIYLK